jgi:hypothetical protein
MDAFFAPFYRQIHEDDCLPWHNDCGMRIGLKSDVAHATPFGIAFRDNHRATLADWQPIGGGFSGARDWIVLACQLIVLVLLIVLIS